MPDKTPKKKTTNFFLQETAQTDMVGSYTDTIGKWFTESKEKGEGESGNAPGLMS
jgi:hypothetical protein